MRFLVGVAICSFHAPGISLAAIRHQPGITKSQIATTGKCGRSSTPRPPK